MENIVMENRLDSQGYGAPIRPTAMSVSGVMGSFGHTRPPARGRATVGVARPAPAAVPASPSQPKRARKDRGPNWVPQEIFFLIKAKRDQFLEELDTVDGRDLMTPETTKWNRVSEHVMRGGYSPILRDGPACKTKWNQILPDYKRIADYLCRTGRNIPEYWDLTAGERKTEGLPRQFAQDVFDAIHEWYGNRPQMQPPHVRDMLAPNDANYRRPQHAEQHAEEGDNEPDCEDPLQMSQPEPFDSTEGSTPPRSPRMATAARAVGSAFTDTTASPSSLQPSRLPPGITTHILSSSDTSQHAVHRRAGNTGVRRKSVSGHTVIADATKATGALMATQMQEIADASRDLERSKIEVQLKLFSEQMEYQREKDRRLYENVTIANDNARLAILKQGEMVSCLAQLSIVTGHSLSMASAQGLSPMPHGGHTGFPTSTAFPTSTGYIYASPNNTAGTIASLPHHVTSPSKRTAPTPPASTFISPSLPHHVTSPSKRTAPTPPASTFISPSLPQHVTAAFHGLGTLSTVASTFYNQVHPGLTATATGQQNEGTPSMDRTSGITPTAEERTRSAAPGSTCDAESSSETESD